MSSNTISTISTSNVESVLLNSISNISYILIDLNDGSIRPIAVFSFYLDAYKYIVRETVNNCQDVYNEMVEDQYPDYVSTEKTYTEYVKDYIKEYTKIISVHHLDLSNPVFGKDLFIDMTKYCVNRNFKNRIIKINPSLPELKSFSIDDN